MAAISFQTWVTSSWEIGIVILLARLFQFLDPRFLIGADFFFQRVLVGDFQMGEGDQEDFFASRRRNRAQNPTLISTIENALNGNLPVRRNIFPLGFQLLCRARSDLSRDRQVTLHFFEQGLHLHRVIYRNLGIRMGFWKEFSQMSHASSFTSSRKAAPSAACVIP